MKEWATGDIITAEAMNSLESGALPHITFTMDSSSGIMTCDKTVDELASSFGFGGWCIIKQISGSYESIFIGDYTQVKQQSGGVYYTFTAYKFTPTQTELKISSIGIVVTSTAASQGAIYSFSVPKASS